MLYLNLTEESCNEKIVLNLILVSASLFAWSVVNTKRVSNSDSVEYYISCDNGRTTAVLNNTLTGQWFYGSSIYNSMDSAVNDACR